MLWVIWNIYTNTHIPNSTSIPDLLYRETGCMTQQKLEDVQKQEDLPYLLAEVRDTVELFTEL